MVPRFHVRRNLLPENRELGNLSRHSNSSDFCAIPSASRTVKIIQKKTERFPAAFKVRNDLLTQGYGIDRAKSSTLLSKSTEAESSADKSPNKKLTSVHSQNSATTEQL